MSGIAGTCRRDGFILSHDVVAPLTRGIAQCGPDGTSYAVSGAAVLIHALFDTGPSSRPPSRLHRDAHDRLVVFDGRIDNRDELLRELDLRANTTDAGIVAALVERTGPAFEKMIGDFAAALWDPSTRTLILTRDPFGTRPLYYHANAQHVLFATALDALLDPRLGIDTTIDDGYLGGYMTASVRHEETPFRAIRLVPPGWTLTFTPLAEKRRRFWALESLPDIRLKSDAEYEERLLALFRDSVRARMQTDRPVAAELSGGVDSSSIVCTADALLREHAVPAAGLSTLSYVFDDSPLSDERRFIDPVERKTGRPAFHLREEEHRILSLLDQVDSPLSPTPELCFAARHRHVKSTMDRIGARVLLRGIGGDQVLWGEVDLYEPYDHFVSGNIVAVHRSLRAWARALGVPYLELLRQSVLRPFLASFLRSAAVNERRIPTWLSPAFVEHAGIRDRVTLLQPSPGLRPSSRAQAQMIDFMVTYFSLGYFLDDGTIEVSYPFVDRRFVEFCFGIPLEQKLRPEATRAVLRRAMRDLLPPEIAARRSKGGPDQAIHHAVAREYHVLRVLFDDSRAAAHGLIERDTFLSALDRARHGVNIRTPALLRIISIECWLRALEKRRRRAAA